MDSKFPVLLKVKQAHSIVNLLKYLTVGYMNFT